MPKALRIALPIVLLASVYCAFAASMQPDSGDAADAVMNIWFASMIIIGMANVVNACLDRGEGSPRRLAFWDMLLKLCLIPFYLFVFVGGLLLSFVLAIIPGFIFATPILAAMLAVIDYALLLLTSSYGFASVVRAQKQGLITKGTAVVLGILHVFFVADVVAAIVLYAMIRNAEKPVLTAGSPSEA